MTMDPTTKEGREALRRAHVNRASNLRKNGTPHEDLMAEFSEETAAALEASASDIEKLEKERDEARGLCGSTMQDNDTLRAELEQIDNAIGCRPALERFATRAEKVEHCCSMAGANEDRAVHAEAELERAREAFNKPLGPTFYAWVIHRDGKPVALWHPDDARRHPDAEPLCLFREVKTRLDVIDAALSPTAPVTGEKEPPGAVLDRAQASLALVEAVINSGRSEEWLRNFETALIAAAKARSTANG